MGAASLSRLARSFGKPATSDERPDVDRCEQLRRRLLTSNVVVGDVFEALQEPTTFTTVAQETAHASCSPEKGLLLYRTVRLLRPCLVVEFGSALGVSGSYLAAALASNGEGALVTVEGSASRSGVAAASIESVAPGVVRARVSLFDDAFEELAGAQLFFNDGNHQPEAVLRYADEAVARMQRPATILVDDVEHFSTAMTGAWRNLRADRRFSEAAEAGGVGMLRLLPV